MATDFSLMLKFLLTSDLLMLTIILNPVDMLLASSSSWYVMSVVKQLNLC